MHSVSQQTTIDGRSPDHTNDFEMRSFEIDSCPLLKMLCSHSMQAGYTLNVLHTLDRIGEMKSLCGYQGECCCEFVCICSTFDHPTSYRKPLRDILEEHIGKIAETAIADKH